MKLQRFMRDIPKHERSSFNYNNPFAEEVEETSDAEEGEESSDGEGLRYDRLEDLFNMDRGSAFQEALSYEPVMYKLVKELDRRNQKDQSLVEIQEGFLDRTERLMRQHQQRSHIHDGLKSLNDREIIAKVRESPKKLKKRALGFLGVLRKYNVTLDSDANPQIDHIEDKNIKKFFKKKEALVRTTLMQADLEFEYPQKLEKIIV